MAIPVFPAVSLELQVSPTSVAPSAHAFEAWLPGPLRTREHSSTLLTSVKPSR